MALSFPPPSSRHKTSKVIIIALTKLAFLALLKISTTIVLLVGAALSETTLMTIPSSFVCPASIKSSSLPSSSLSSSPLSYPRNKKEKLLALCNPSTITIVNNVSTFYKERKHTQLWNSIHEQQSQRERQQLGRKSFIQSSFLFSSSLIFQPPSSNAILSTKQKSSSVALEDALDQIDLAVQASSVQAWEEASNLIYDEILDEPNLSRAFDNTKMENVERQKVSEYIQNMRDILTLGNEKKKLSTEDAMSVMKYGTNARTALRESMR